jgi:hypothetical protein
MNVVGVSCVNKLPNFVQGVRPAYVNVALTTSSLCNTSKVTIKLLYNKLLLLFVGQYCLVSVASIFFLNYQLICFCSIFPVKLGDRLMTDYFILRSRYQRCCADGLASKRMLHSV